MQISLILSMVVLGATVCYGYREYQMDIPNGDSCPDPCTADTSDVWTRVGHDIEDPTTCIDKERDQKNAFGMDYLQIRRRVVRVDDIWPELCYLDSDGDGRSNGDELGDSMCVWRYGMENPGEAILYHPGIPENPDGTLSPENSNFFCQCQIM